MDFRAPSTTAVGIGPIAKVRLERIAAGAHVSKDLAEELLAAAVKEFWAAVAEGAAVELDLPGVGKIQVGCWAHSCGS